MKISIQDNGQQAVIAYIRVSTDEQADKNNSLEHQEDMVDKYCNLVKKYNLLKLFSEDYSAKTFKRPVWKELMAFIKANKGLVKKIVFLRWDRFSRNLLEALIVIKKFQELQIELDCIEQPLDLNIPESLLMLSIYLSVPEIENTKNSIRTRDCLRQAMSNGCWVTKPPLGYKRFRVQLKKDSNAATIIPDENADIIVDIFKKMATGVESAETIRNYLFKKYQIRRTKQGVLNILRNEVYRGNIVIAAFKDEPERVVKGLHEGIVDDSLFEDVQSIITGKKRRHVRSDKSHQFPLKGVLVCSLCGRSLTGSTSKGRVEYYSYYHCSCSSKGHDRVALDIMHSSFDMLLKEICIKSEVKTLFQKVFIDLVRSSNSDRNKEKLKIESEIEVIRKRRTTIENAYADDNIDINKYKAMTDRFNQEENDLILKHALLKAESSIKPNQIDYALSVFSNFHMLYSRVNHEAKKKLLGSIFTAPLQFQEKVFRTKEVSILMELLVLNNNELDMLKIEKSHQIGGSSNMAPQTGLEPVTL